MREGPLDLFPLLFLFLKLIFSSPTQTPAIRLVSAAFPDQAVYLNHDLWVNSFLPCSLSTRPPPPPPPSPAIFMFTATRPVTDTHGDVPPEVAQGGGMHFGASLSSLKLALHETEPSSLLHLRFGRFFAASGSTSRRGRLTPPVFPFFYGIRRSPS